MSTPAPDRDLIPPMPPHVASEFLLWLAWREALGNNDYRLSDGNEVFVEVCEEVELKLPEEEKASVVLRNLNSNEHPELLASLRAGRTLHRAKLRVLSGDREYRLTLSGPQLAWSGIKLPKMIKAGDLPEILLDEMFVYEDLHRSVRGVFALYAARRVDLDRWTQEGLSIRSWLGESFARVFAFDPMTGQGSLFGVAS